MPSPQGTLWQEALRIVQVLRSAGHEAVFAGGCVRDCVMGLQPKDIDIATSAAPEQIKGLFDRCLTVGESFGVVVVLSTDHHYEVATFRSESGYSDGRHPDHVEFTDARGDVQRRDFTINGLLLDPLTNEVIDYVGGRQDLAGRLVRAIGEPEQRFQEDRLRMLRAIRFAARFGFDIHEHTFQAIRRSARDIGSVSAERVRDELVHVFTGPHADRGLDLMHETGLLREVLPEVEALRGVAQPQGFHPEGDAFEHTRKMLGLMENPSVELAFGVLLHDIGKPPSFTVSDRIRFPGHEKAGGELARAIGARLRFSNDERKDITDLVEGHMRFKDAKNMKTSTLKRFLRQERFDDHLELHRLDCLASNSDLTSYDYCRGMMETLSEDEIRPPALITGHDLIQLGLSPGPPFSEILKAVEDAQLEGTLKTRDQALQFVRERCPELASADATGEGKRGGTAGPGEAEGGGPATDCSDGAC